MRALNLDAIRERAQALDRQAKVEFFRNASTEVLNLCDEVVLTADPTFWRRFLTLFGIRRPVNFRSGMRIWRIGLSSWR